MYAYLEQNKPALWRLLPYMPIYLLCCVVKSKFPTKMTLKVHLHCVATDNFVSLIVSNGNNILAYNLEGFAANDVKG